MELEVTAAILGFLTNDPEPVNLSCSAAEMGAYAGAGSWRASVAAGSILGELSAEQLEEIREHFADYGAWDDAEVAAWTESELRGLLLQEIAADWRESYEAQAESLGLELTESADWPAVADAVRALADSGTIQGRLYPADVPEMGGAPVSADKARWFVYLGN